MNVWKIASRWSDTGTKASSILDLFRKYGIVFVGTNKATARVRNEVKVGDIIAISDGKKIVSVGKVIGEPIEITHFEFQEEDKKRFHYEDWVIGFKVEIYNLNQDEIFETKFGAFHSMGKFSERVKKLFQSKTSDSSFSIDSYTYTVLNNQTNAKSLLQNDIKYLIPVYQRPYSWNEAEIETFINDIFFSFWGNEKNTEPEPMFIGTMQLSEKKYNNKTSFYQEVIDGQQRITTITLLLKFLAMQYPAHTTLQNLQFDWLLTDVNRGQQYKNLQALLIDNAIDSLLNKYAQNYNHISDFFKQNINNEENDVKVEFDENKFIDFVFNSLYFVVIETKAGLSKTLKIFNTINTAGLDLNNTDIFKIRLYEYLSLKGDNKEIFESIDKLYEKIANNNSQIGRQFTDMNQILSIYKFYLISKHNLNMTLWKMGTGTFFERLFDTLLNIKEWDGFTNLKGISNLLKIETIDKIIDIRFDWELKHYGEKGDFDSFDSMLSLRLLWWSRYSGYWTMPFIYLIDNPDSKDNYYKLFQKISRVYITYSLIYQKQVNEIHKFTRYIATQLVNPTKSIDEVWTELDNKYKVHQKTIVNILTNHNIFDNTKIKNIVVRMSAALDEKENNTPLKDIEKLVFDSDIDIEHIQARNDENVDERARIIQEWGSELNAIGNLVILEQNINRSISNKPFEEKKNRYIKSDFKSVKDLSQQPSWEINDAENRRKKEVEKIEKFLYSS